MIRVPKRNGRTFREHSLLSLQFGLPELLRYEDRNSMAFSIESRVPFLDHRLVEMTLALPTSSKISDGWTKHILRKSVVDKLPTSVVWRKDKKGFLTPQQAWKDKTMPALIDYLERCHIPDVINRDFLKSLCAKPNMSASELSEFWRLYSVLKWLDIFKIEVVDG